MKSIYPNKNMLAEVSAEFNRFDVPTDPYLDAFVKAQNGEPLDECIKECPLYTNEWFLNIIAKYLPHDTFIKALDQLHEAVDAWAHYDIIDFAMQNQEWRPVCDAILKKQWDSKIIVDEPADPEKRQYILENRQHVDGGWIRDCIGHEPRVQV